MPRTSRSPDFLALQRKQLDAKLRPVRELGSIEPPSTGWIRTVRTALGMSAAQLGKRLGMSPQGALDLERREVRGDVTVSTLRKAATALGCDLTVALVPNPALEETIHRQATLKAQQERNRVVHTMRLEDQEKGVEESLDPATSVQTWLTTRLARLWD